MITPSLYLEMILSCRPYKDAVRTCLKELKYYDNSNVLPFFKELIADFLKTDSGGFGNIDLLLSVPSYSAQYASRKTDHSRTIASIVSELTGIPVGHKILVKTRKTHQQARLPRQTRLTNLRNCFSVVDPLFVKGKHLLIVDDIITTGTTMNECAKALKRAGAFKLSGLTIAKTY